jgi:sigma-B regulation protein RsbU (phosphoserine phosphatase)
LSSRLPNQNLDTNSKIFRVVRALYVEDSAGDIRLLNTIIRKIEDPQFDISVANSVLSAEKLCSSHRYDLLLIDMNLPNSVGLNTVSRILEICTGTPVVILSDKEDETLARRAVKMGVQDYILKGEVTPRGFRRAISHALYRAEARKTKLAVGEGVRSRALARLQAVSGNG